MKLTTKALAIGFALVAGIAFAEAEATDPNVIARQDLMKTFGGAAKALGEMASGKVAYDAAAAEAAKQVLVAGSAQIAAKFEANAVDPATEAKPEIWTGWDDFITKGKGLETAAQALDVSSIEMIGAGMAGVGGACKACHTTYRMAK